MYRLMSGHFSFQVTLSELIYNILPLGYKYRFTHCHFHGEVVKLKYFHKLCCIIKADFKTIPNLAQNYKGSSFICIKTINHQCFKKEWETCFLFLKASFECKFILKLILIYLLTLHKSQFQNHVFILYFNYMSQYGFC